MAPHSDKCIQSTWPNLQMQNNKVSLSLLSEQSDWVKLSMLIIHIDGLFMEKQ